MPEAAKRAVFDGIAKLFQKLNVARFPLTLNNAGEHFEHTLCAEAAMDAFSAGFFRGEIQKELRHADHAGAFVHNDHTAGAHDSTCCAERFIVNDGVKQIRGDTTAGRSAHLHSFERFAVADSAADVENDVAQGFAHRDFDKTAAAHFTGQRKHLCAFAAFGTHCGKRRAAVV